MKSAIVLMLALALGGCAGRVKDWGQPSPTAPVNVVIHNRNWATVNVFAVRDGSWARLGMVTTNGTERSQLPAWVLSGGATVRLKVETIGGRETFLTEPILVGAGQDIVLNVQATLTLTSWSVQ